MRRVLGTNIVSASGITSVHHGMNNTVSCGQKWGNTCGWWKRVAKIYRTNTL